MATQILGKVGVVPKGDYNSSTTYERLDIVTYNGGSYMALGETIGNLPTNTTYWQLLTQKGTDGQDGYTPVKGTDYWTNADKTEIVGSATTQVETDIQPTLTRIEGTANDAKSIAEGANQALSFSNYSSMVTAFNGYASDKFKVGQNIMIITLEVPDLWIESVESTSSTYTYTTDAAFISALNTNGYVQVGYYKISALETQKVDLTDYYTKSETNTLLGGKYTKPSTGIPSTDMANAVQTSLGKADTSIQPTNFAYDSTTETLTITIS